MCRTGQLQDLTSPGETLYITASHPGENKSRKSRKVSETILMKVNLHPNETKGQFEINDCRFGVSLVFPWTVKRINLVARKSNCGGVCIKYYI